MHGGHEMRRPGDAAAAILFLLLWLAALTFAFQGCGGGFLRCGGSLTVVERNSGSVSIGRKMLLAVDPSSAAGPGQQRHHHPHPHHHHRHRGHRHRQHSKWNWHGIPPSAAAAPGDGNETDPRYGVEKRLVPTGPNPLHH